MKKKTVLSILAALIVSAGYLFNNFTVPGAVPVSTPAVATEIPQQIAEASREGMYPNGFIQAKVSKVTDGDTLEISYRGKEYKVRLLDVDTPESVKPGTPVQPYAKEASRYTGDKVLNRQVRLVFDKGLKDRYERLLAFVILEDGTFLNAALVSEGYARVETVSPNTTHKKYFEGLQEEAINNKKGLWGLPEEKQPFVKTKKGDYVPRYYVDRKAS